MPPDMPKDSPIAVHIGGNKKVCYIPQFSVGTPYGSYIGLLNCSLSEAKSARYDILNRLAYYINNMWVCITAPNSIVIYKGDKDYVYLSPCVINDAKQQWKIRDGVFYSLDESYSLKDDGNYVYVLKQGNRTSKK
ncbi:DUF1561 family protein [uncultured Helicobacter sp.]|uniref:DUF1561 family protein n=1 Tax=uncultured Helicobacter sp. TaxID=175537 RepID=UPI0025974C1B|nr:DUF1561 family protein [uncultured Helicobacter sp.]